ncbi:MAG TPA: hypothetical protein VFE22_01745 [Edaphobacter sp.]|jgi:hypothetical protein|nr:hypothetical protein [Edaphobacter sp.]
MTPSTLLKYALACAILFPGVGCNSKSAPTPENFIQGLNKHFADHPDCLFSNMRFPYETSDRKETAQMDTLVASKLLDKTVESAIHVNRYTVNSVGTRYAPRFCYGHRVVNTIDSSTPPVIVNGFKQTQVTYHYSMQEVPVWAKSADVLAAFPAMAEMTSGKATGAATLAQTTVGWQVPD